ncbi:DNA polymerase phi-domain-containing protein [Phascolomyces articulosus]|uniref:DNA polymerase phi-domain-containing protein n=1 Tax=Phascolomyces articulosus TaxID=60185 RepID=A0AAD5K8C0_9FUNG|nr:DNA polymerase phi-domain-containing protein [Phascolomyces articulosus]
MAASTLQHYWDLASFDPAVRINAAQSLVRSLAEFQKDHEATLQNGTHKTATTEDELDTLCAPDVSYALRRLLRGLPSSRQGARQGFSLALTELLAITDVVNVSLVLNLLFKHTERTGGMSSDETRDMLFGRIFGLIAIVAAGMISKSTTTYEDIERILDSLSEMTKIKSYVVEICHHVVINMIPYVNALEFKDKVIEKILELFLTEVVNVDELNIALTIQQNLPDVDLSSQFSDWKSTNVLAPNNLVHLASVLKEVPSDDGEKKDKKVADWKPQLHSVWDRLLATYFETETKQANGHADLEESDRPKKKMRVNKKGDGKAKAQEDDKKAPFSEFWDVCVDQTLFDNGASQGRKYWGFKLVQRVLRRVSSDQMSVIFTPNFMRCFINSLSSGDRYLNKVASHTANVIQDAAKENKEAGFALVTQLVGNQGRQDFDRLTRTRTVENILKTMDAEGIKSYLNYLAQIFIEQSDASQANGPRAWVLKQLTFLVKNNAIPKEEDWLLSVVQFLMVYAFFDIKKSSSKKSFFEGYRKPATPLSEATLDQCKESFQTVLMALEKMPPLAKVKELGVSSLRSRRLNGTMNDGELWVYRVYEAQQKLIKDKNLQARTVLSKESQASLKKAIELMESLRKKLKADDKYDSVERGFELLFLHMILHFMIDEEETESVLAELFECYNKITSTPKKSSAKGKKGKKAKATEEEDEDVEPEPIDVIVDILVSFMTNSSPMLKNLAEQVFEMFSHKVTKQTLGLLFDLLKSSDSKNEAEDLFDEDMDEVDSDVEVIEDVEMEEDEDDSEESEDEDENGEVDEELRRKVEEAMRNQGVLGGDDDDEEDEDLNDEAMFGFDDKLAEIFKQKRLANGKDNKEEQNIYHFKNSVADLVIIFVRKNPENPLVLQTIVPLLNILRVTPARPTTNQFLQKIIAFLKNKLAKATEHPKVEDVDDALEILTAVHDFTKTKGATNKELADMGIQLSMYLRKCIFGGADIMISDNIQKDIKQRLDKTNAIYCANLCDYYRSKKHTRIEYDLAAFLPKNFPYSSWPLLDSLLEFINPSACHNNYRHTQNLEWISTIVNRTVDKSSETYDKLFLSIVPKIVKISQESIKNAVKGTDKKVLDTNSMKSFLKFLLVIVRKHKKLTSIEDLQKTWKAQETFSSITNIKNYGDKPSLEALRKQLLALFNH